MDGYTQTRTRLLSSTILTLQSLTVGKKQRSTEQLSLLTNPRQLPNESINPFNPKSLAPITILSTKDMRKLGKYEERKKKNIQQRVFASGHPPNY